MEVYRTRPLQDGATAVLASRKRLTPPGIGTTSMPRCERAGACLGYWRGIGRRTRARVVAGAEIAGSPVILNCGQAMLSGDINGRSVRHARHESFLWATLHPVSAVESAEAQNVRSADNLFPTVYVLRLDEQVLKVVGISSCHAGLRLTVTAAHALSGLNVREAILGL